MGIVNIRLHGGNPPCSSSMIDERFTNIDFMQVKSKNTKTIGVNSGRMQDG
jgi:hypothetical protein